jgi:hypothetical protein
MENCDNSSTNYREYFANALGTYQQDTTHVRTGGSTNGTTPVSWSLTCTTKARFLMPFVTRDIAQWNATSGSSQTVTVYLMSTAALNNSQIWLEIEYPGSSSSPLGSTVNTRMALLGTPTTLTTDMSTWGSATSYIYKIVSPSFTPQMAGIIKARLYVAAPSTTTIYVDRNIYDSSGQTVSRTYTLTGFGVVNETGSSGTSGGSYVF